MATHIYGHNILTSFDDKPEVTVEHEPADFRRLASEDVPNFSKPAPTKYNSLQYTDMVDPKLCLTPEKNSSLKKTVKRTVSPLDRRKSKNNTKIRTVQFDNNVDVWHMSPERETENKYLNSEEQNGYVDDLSFDEIQGPECEETLNDSDNYEESDITGTSSDSGTQSTASISELGYPSHMMSKEFRSQVHDSASFPLVGVDRTPEHMLARPEFQSTLRFSHQMKQVTAEEINLSKAVETKLKVSEKVRNRVTEKSHAKLNIEENSMFPQLISVDVKKDEILSNIEKEMESKVRPSHKSTHPRPEEQLAQGPDILEFFSPSLEHESPCLVLENTRPAPVFLQTAHPDRAFDVYQHIRSWHS